jgi:hypothetical protein
MAPSKKETSAERLLRRRWCKKCGKKKYRTEEAASAAAQQWGYDETGLSIMVYYSCPVPGSTAFHVGHRKPRGN